MKKSNKDITDKTIMELVKEAHILREELTKLKLERKINVVKNTNLYPVKKNRLAVVLTVLNQKQEMEQIKDKRVSNLSK